MDRFYPIIDRADWLPRLLPCGVRFVQLRMKDQPETGLRAEIARARDLCAAAGAILVVNDYWQLAIDLRCDWLHLGQEDLVEADLSAIRKAGLKLGVSTHSDDELETALTARPDYIALGPVYPTTLKKMPWAPQGVPRVSEWKRRLGAIPLVAIGGLTLERAAPVYAAGADAIAVVSDVLKAPNPEARAHEWVRATR
ncbi:thiamine-phosphate pyrophosphorylase [Elstera litoralis]|uniref:Thiamine-phosphate synthase n=1 Tax=Elstera litoralis TaxID=552518 RepID=A0A0F3IRW1_9PROT|nr:thiamine phosphate synthase [Elstera litoralis]KJV08324.1 thiamine-phosphate pyrophosphorylase [Elstera litoralis]